MRNSAILSNEARLALPGSFTLGDIQFISGERRDYRSINFVPMDRIRARQALGIPANDFILMIQDDFSKPEATIQLLPEILQCLPPTGRGQLYFMGGTMDLPDSSFCKGLAELDLHMENSRCSWKWLFTGQKPERLMKYYYSAANLVVLSIHSNTQKLKELLQSMLNPVSAHQLPAL